MKDLKAENLYLQEELDRVRLSLSGAHPSTTLNELLGGSATRSHPSTSGNGAGPGPSDSADEADDLIAIQAQAIAIQGELLRLLGMLRMSIDDFESRLAALGHPQSALEVALTLALTDQVPETSLPADGADQAIEPAGDETVPLERAAVERAALERAALERAALERAALERAAVERAALERAALERDVLERTG